jgi:hypothetical protein
MRRAILILMLLDGCSSSLKTVPEDPTLARFDHAGDIAYNRIRR